MKFNCGLTREEKFYIRRKELEKLCTYLSNWHPWFAWYPVKVGSKDCRWLETVERCYPHLYRYSWDDHLSGWGTVIYRSMD